MANHKSALKKSKQDLVRRARNRAAKNRLRGALKKFRGLLATEPGAAAGELSSMISLIDRTAKKGYIHHNAANRLKSKLTTQTSAAAA